MNTAPLRSADISTLWSVDAEKELIGAVLATNDLYVDAAAVVEPHDFYVDHHAHVWSAIGRLLDQGNSATPATVNMAVRDLHQGFKQTTGRELGEYLATLYVDAGPYRQLATASNAKWVAELAQRRRIFNAADDARCQIVDTSVSADAVIATFTAAAESRSAAEGEPKPIAHFLQRVTEDAERVYQGHEPTIPTYIPALDRVFGGFAPTDLILLAGRPSMGKSAFAQALGTMIATRCMESDGDEGANVLMFSLEMGGEQLARRLMGAATSIPYEQFIKRHRVNETMIERMMGATRDMEKLPFYIDPRPEIRVNQIRATVRRMKASRKGRWLVMVDYLGLITPSDRYSGNQVAEVGEISKGLKAIAKEQGVPVLALCQLNRQNESRGDKRPQLHDLRSSGNLEQDADSVLFIHRDSYYEEAKGADDADARARLASIGHDAEIIIAKQRMGARTTAPVFFDPARNLVGDRP